jgi:hypothetical protein
LQAALSNLLGNLVAGLTAFFARYLSYLVFDIQIVDPRRRCIGGNPTFPDFLPSILLLNGFGVGLETGQIGQGLDCLVGHLLGGGDTDRLFDILAGGNQNVIIRLGEKLAEFNKPIYSSKKPFCPSFILA